MLTRLCRGEGEDREMDRYETIKNAYKDLGGEATFYDGMSLLYFVMAKTKIGNMAACKHCRNSVSEMGLRDLYYEK